MKKTLVSNTVGPDGSLLAELSLEEDYEIHGIVRRPHSLNCYRIDPLYTDPRDDCASG